MAEPGGVDPDSDPNLMENPGSRSDRQGIAGTGLQWFYVRYENFASIIDLREEIGSGPDSQEHPG